jgi:hypothetical protein
MSTIYCGQKGHEMMFTIEFFRIRKEDDAHATLSRVTHIASDLESAQVKAMSLFNVGTLNMPQNPDGLRILDQVVRCSFGRRARIIPRGSKAENRPDKLQPFLVKYFQL